jgi:hypothetical protein
LRFAERRRIGIRGSTFAQNSSETSQDFICGILGHYLALILPRVQYLFTDKLLEAVEGACGADVDYAQLVKRYESSQEEVRYSPAVCTSCERKAVTGKPDPKHISTSFVERQNLTMRMSMRRFTRLTNGFSKKLMNHLATVAIYFMYYNFARVHQTLRVTPAMEAGVSDHVWSYEEIIGIMPKPVFRPRGPYKKKNSD